MMLSNLATIASKQRQLLLYLYVGIFGQFGHISEVFKRIAQKCTVYSCNTCVMCESQSDCLVKPSVAVFMLESENSSG